MTLSIKFPKFGVKKPEGMTDEQIFEEIERKAVLLIGNYLHKEQEQALKTLRHGGRINHVFNKMGVSYGPRARPSTISKKMIPPRNISSEAPGAKSKSTKKKKTSKKLPDIPKPPALKTCSSSTISRSTKVNIPR